jgi:bifunctional NMN adenylyltransferase/nudix hydrolase
MTSYKQNDAPLEDYTVGIIVGRFQTPMLHEGHIDLFDHVCGRHDRVVVYLGNSPVVDPDNFLDYQQRKAMILEKYPNVEVLYIHDTNENKTWSPRLDELVSHQLRPMEKPLLYGSRDSFIKAYMDGKGRYDCEEFEAKRMISATEIRKGLSKKLITGYLVRVGMFLASLMRYPTAYQTVDVAIMDDDRKNIWLGRKKDERRFRFIGGFSDPKTISLEEDAKRETMEETHIELSEPTYIFSTLIDDWRYRRSRDKIKTSLWIGDRIGGQPQPDDDIVEIKKVPITDFIWEEGTAPIIETLKNGKDLVKGHHKLMLKLVEYLQK